MADPPKDLINAIREGRALIVCGAGVTRLATDGAAPGWADLINQGLEYVTPRGGNEPAWVRACRELLKPDASADDWLEAADTIQEKLGGRDGGPYRAFLGRAVGKLKATSPAVLDALRAIGEVAAAGRSKNRIATKNYDDLLREGLGWDRVTWTDSDSAAECLRGEHQAVLHLHGHWREPTSVVFSKRDYERLRSADRAQFLQQLAAHNFALVFIGCSTAGLADENVGELLDWFGVRWSGLGKKHFVLVSEGDLSADWPPAVTPVAYGTVYSELPEFLASLASLTPAATSTSAPTPISTPTSAPASGAAAVPKLERAPFPPDPRMIGRRDRLEEVVGLVLNGDRPIIVPGAPGMGKTTLALAAAYDKRVRAKFGKARIFVNLEPVTSAEAMLRALGAALALDTTGSVASILELLAAHAAREPTLAILDNLEAPWEAEPVKTEEILGQLAGIEGLRLALTVRGETPRVSGGTATLDDVPRLQPEDAKELFPRESRSSLATDPALPSLLAALDGHPLSIVLMAARTDGRHDLAGLARDWQMRRAAVLARGPGNDRLTSVRVSLGLSLDRLTDRPDAKQLLGLVARLPAGLQEEDITALLPGAGADVASVLERARLVEMRDGRLTMLAPLRETVCEEELLADEDEGRLCEHFLQLAADGEKIGFDSWPSVRERVMREGANLDTVCQLALRKMGVGANFELLDGALRGVAKLNRFGLPVGTASLDQGRKLTDAKAFITLKANCIRGLGDIARDRSDNDTARALYQEARPLYEGVGDLRGQADCILGLGVIACDGLDHDTAPARFEEARRLYEHVGHLRGQANCILKLGDIALSRFDLDAARARYEGAKSLYERVGDPLGQANCIKGLGDIALQSSDRDTARARYEEAQPLYDRIGGLAGQANCIQGLGDIALERSDHDAARTRFEEARLLYERVGSVLGQANSIRSLGDIALKRSDLEAARARYEEALALYGRIPEPYSIGFTHLELMQCAADGAGRDRHKAAARVAWESIGRQDLIAEHLDA